MTTPPARVAIVGAGGVGAFFAAHLSTTDHTVVACVRRPFDTYQIDSQEHPFTGPAIAITEPQAVPWDGPADWVLVGLKAHQSAGAANWFDRLCGPDTRVVALQNGVEAEARLGPLTHGAQVLPAVVYCGAELVAPGHVKHSTSARLILPDIPAAHDCAALFAGTDMSIEPSQEHLKAAWVKLSINSVANGLSALTGKPMGVLAEPGIAELGLELMEEATRVGIAEGANLTFDGLADRVAAMSQNTNTRTSMLQDTDAGRPTEFDAIHGAIVRIGARHGIPTPATEVIHRLLESRSPK